MFEDGKPAGGNQWIPKKRKLKIYMINEQFFSETQICKNMEKHFPNAQWCF